MPRFAVFLAIAVTPPVIAQTPPYWQQRLDYVIEASLDESRGVLGGTQRVRYQNNSPDTLRTISFHLYLNAFRPGSRWSLSDSLEGRRRFNDLREPDFGFNRVRDVMIEGQRVEPVYPFAPDSTIVRFALPRPVPPNGSFSTEMAWEARPPTVVRRSGRRGRQYDLGQWYPRVVAYDRKGWAEHALYPSGEFYGDFGRFRVTLDVPADQVIGATGVPVCGDPGWRDGRTDGRAVDFGRDAYGVPDCGGVGVAAAGRKRVVFEAHDVHHFALSMNPDYRYEGGRFGSTLIHVLHWPGDSATWGRGIAVERTRVALEWLHRLFGPYPWPQITNIHRLDTGATEYPMMVHDASASQGLILHEVGHNYLMGILANNEWREGFLDEGFTNYQVSLFAGDSGVAARDSLERSMLRLDLDGWSQPVSFVSEDYRDAPTYSSAIYNRGQLFYHQLQRIVGDSVMRAILRTYYDRWKLKHVTEEDFRRVAEEVSKQDLRTFFAQWLHGTVLYDYAVGKVRTERRPAGPADGWVTSVEVIRKADGIFPVEVVVRSDSDSALTRVTGQGEREWVTLHTAGRPKEVEIDPRVVAHDWYQLNNRKKHGLLGFARAPRTDVYLDRVFSERARRDAKTLGLVPTLWYNDEGGVTLGVRARSNYFGRFDRTSLTVSMRTRSFAEGSGDSKRVPAFFLRTVNPATLYAPRRTVTLEGYWVEGRAGAAAQVERQTSLHRTIGPETYRGAGLRWLVATDTDYLDPALWDAGGTIEAQTWVRSRSRGGTWALSGRAEIGGGIEYRNRGDGVSTDDSYDAQPYLRLLAEVSGRRTLGPARKVGIQLRGYAGWVESGRRPLKQRQLFVSGADPYQQFSNPFLRSRGSLLAGEDIHYHMPGGGGVRGLAPGTTATRLVAMTAEVDRLMFRRVDRDSSRMTGMKLARDIRVAAFGDVAFGNGDIPARDGRAALVADAGLGVRVGHRIGQTSFVTRFDFPFLVTRPRLAASGTDGSARVRIVVSFQ